MLDWMMPGMDGPDAVPQDEAAARDQRACRWCSSPRKASQRELDELKTLGAAGTISKPFSPKDLPDQLRAIWAELP